MIVVNALRLPAVREHLQEAGYVVAEVTTPVEAALRPAQAELARALRLPEGAGTNLDAMVDALRDLPEVWGTEQLALVWHDAQRMASEDGRSWWLLSEILDDAEDLMVVAVGEQRVGRPDPVAPQDDSA